MGLQQDLLLICFIPLGFVYIVVPLLFNLIPDYMQHVFFLNFVRAPYVDYANLSLYGIRSIGRNFYLEKDSHASAKSPAVVETLGSMVNEESVLKWPKMGVWHILPESLSRQYQERGEVPTHGEMEKSLSEGIQNIVIYLHGNSFDRATACRCELYNTLSAMDYHVLSIDYRGYGDSTGKPTEQGLAEDAHAIYYYAKKIAPQKHLIVWGHSMGTGVAALAVSELCDAKIGPSALVLESPFNNLRDVVRYHPFSIPLRILPWFDKFIVEPLIRSGLVMNTDERLKRVTCPILILHAEDDNIIPVDLARKLYEGAKAAKLNVTYVEFESKHEFQHKYIHKAKELPEIMRKFMEDCRITPRPKPI